MFGWIKCHCFGWHTWVYPDDPGSRVGMCRYCTRTCWQPDDGGVVTRFCKQWKRTGIKG